jgi:hypothetical protein
MRPLRVRLLEARRHGPEPLLPEERRHEVGVALRHAEGHRPVLPMLPELLQGVLGPGHRAPQASPVPHRPTRHAHGLAHRGGRWLWISASIPGGCKPPPIRPIQTWTASYPWLTFRIRRGSTLRWGAREPQDVAPRKPRVMILGLNRMLGCSGFLALAGQLRYAAGSRLRARKERGR